MGCDIHPAIEVKLLPESPWWDFVAKPDDSRNYQFFGLLAGVRGDMDPWCQPRGFPENMDYDTHNDEHRAIVDGDHTPSWFTLREAMAFVLPPDVDEWTDRQWSNWLRTMRFFADLYDVPPERVRVVFNFDS